MTKKLAYIIYSVLALVSIYIYISIVVLVLDNNLEIELNFLFFTINNPIVLSILAFLVIIFGYIALSNTYEEKSSINATEKIEIDSPAENIEKINKEIENKLINHKSEIINQIESEISNDKNIKLLEKYLWAVCKALNMSVGLVYESNEENTFFKLEGTYAFFGDLSLIEKIEKGIGVNGQAIQSKEPVYIKELPKDYVKIVSGLGEVTPDFLMIIPIAKENKVIYLVELAGLGKYNTEEVKTVVEIVNFTFSKI